MNSIPSYLFDDPLPNTISQRLGRTIRSLAPLSSHDAKLVENIENSHQYQVEDIVHDISGNWLKGKRTLPVTWNTLVTVLEKSDLKVLASDIKQQNRSRDEL